MVILEKETGVALFWLKQNEIIANPEKFHALLHRKYQKSTSGEKTNIDGEIMKSEETLQLLGIALDYRLDLDPQISNICKKDGTQLNVLQGLKLFIGLKEKTILVQRFIFSNFEYCPLGWYLSSSNLFRTLKSYKNVL